MKIVIAGIGKIGYILTSRLCKEGHDVIIVDKNAEILACANNIGPGLELVGPNGNYSAFSDLSKIVLSVDMLLGRLELFPVLIMFSPAALRKKSQI